MARILITGGSGFIGTNLVARFIERSDDVLNFDIQPPRNKEHNSFWREVNILDKAALTKATAEFNPQVVIHLAARTDLGGASVADYPANTVGVSNLIAALRGLPELRLGIFASSMLVCRIGYQPKSEDDYAATTAYGLSKIEGERRVRHEADNFHWVMVRPTSIWGPWFSAPYRDFFDMVHRGMYFHPRGSRVLRNYGFVLNTVFQIEKLVDTEANGWQGRTIYLGDYEPIEVFNWAQRIQRELNAPPVRTVPVCLLWLAAKMGDALKLANIAFPLTTFRLNNIRTNCIVDLKPIQEIAPPLPYDLNTAVALTCRWLESANTKA